MQLVDKVLELLGQLNDVKTIIYDSGYSANVICDRKPAPYAITYLLSDWDIKIDKGYAKEGCEIQIYFADKAKFDATGSEKDVVVGRMEDIAKQFIWLLMHESSINVVSDTIKVRSTWGRFDCFTVGVSLTVRIEEKRGSCLPEPTIPTPEPEQEDGNDDQNEP